MGRGGSPPFFCGHETKIENEEWRIENERGDIHSPFSILHSPSMPPDDDKMERFS
jgi:hypothetical protein